QSRRIPDLRTTRWIWRQGKNTSPHFPARWRSLAHRHVLRLTLPARMATWTRQICSRKFPVAWTSSYGLSRLMRRQRISRLMCVVLALSARPHAQAADAPAFKVLRYEESYLYLRDPSQRSDYLDAIKFIPLNTNGDWYLTLG